TRSGAAVVDAASPTPAWAAIRRAPPRGDTMTQPESYMAMPTPLYPGITETRHWFQAVDNFCRFMSIRQGDRVLMLVDPLLDRRVIDAFSGLAAARGAPLTLYMAPDTRLPAIPDSLKPLIQDA